MPRSVGFSRSWTTRATYRRGLEYIADLTQPVFANGFTAEIGGLCTSRVDFLPRQVTASGASALNRSALTFDTSSADVRVRYALTSNLALYRRVHLLLLRLPKRKAARAGHSGWARKKRRARRCDPLGACAAEVVVLPGKNTR